PSTVLMAAVVVAFSLIGLALLRGGQQHVHARNLAADTADVVGLRQLSRRLLHAERELLLAQVEQVGLEVGGRLLTQFLEFHISAPSGLRKRYAPRAWRRRGGRPRARSLRRYPRLHTARDPAGSAPPNTPRCPCRSPCGPRSASW